MEVRVRFAPSPTGFLHIGSLRTVLFNYLIAKSLNGTLVLRIEDTDQARKVEGSEKKLIEILNWIGLDFDEGPGIIKKQNNDIGKYGPYIQSKRRDIYDQHKELLLNKNMAYHCFCTPERLQAMREDQQAQKLPPRYDKKCRDLTREEVLKKIENGEKYVIRQKIPLNGETIVKDELRGEIKFQNKEIDDQVLIKTDGMPTYQFASVVDDHKMLISHVVRGEEWIPSFPKNILLYEAFGWVPPKFIHMALTLNKGGGKLSKRQGDVAVEDYRAKGYLKEVLINFCALLGWSPYDKESNMENKNKNEEIFSLNELITKFNYQDMGISLAVFDTEKLDFLNGYYIRQKSLEELTELCLPYLQDNLKLTNQANKKKKSFIQSVIKIEQERLKKLSEIGELTEFLFIDELKYDSEMLAWKKMTSQQAGENLKKIYSFLNEITKEHWEREYLENNVIKFLKDNNYKIGEYLWPTRVALSGKKASPGPFEIADVLGKEESLKRIKRAITS